MFTRLSYKLKFITILLIAGSLSVPPVLAQQTQTGKASYYADYFKGRKTASGEKYDPALYTAAHRTLPFGTWVKVTNAKNEKYVIVKVNDRGPFTGGRIIDLSRVAAEDIGMVAAGIANVKMMVVPGPVVAMDTINVDSMPAKPDFMRIEVQRVRSEGWCVDLGVKIPGDSIPAYCARLQREYAIEISILQSGVAESGSWRVFAGDFAEQPSAAILLDRMRKQFPEANIVRFKEVNTKQK